MESRSLSTVAKRSASTWAAVRPTTWGSCAGLLAQSPKASQAVKTLVRRERCSRTEFLRFSTFGHIRVHRYHVQQRSHGAGERVRGDRGMEIDLAVVGASSVLLHSSVTDAYSRLGMLSSGESGRIRSRRGHGGACDWVHPVSFLRSEGAHCWV